MRTLLGVIAGFSLASALSLLGEWAYTLLAGPSLQVEHSAFGLLLTLGSLLYIALTLVAGGYLCSLISKSPEAISGYSVFQLFFGVWFFREFWTTGYVWFRPAVLFLVIPCAMAGRVLARHDNGLLAPRAHTV